MRATNNKKRMLTTRILGLFLTAAMPLSFSVVIAPTVMACEKEELHQEEKSLRIVKQIEEVAEQSTCFPKRKKINLAYVEGNKSLLEISNVNLIPSETYTFGAATHVIQRMLVEKGKDSLLNELLDGFKIEEDSKVSEVLNKGISEITETYLHLLNTIKIGLPNSREVIQGAELRAKTVYGLFNFMEVGVAYRNLLGIAKEKGDAALKLVQEEYNTRYISLVNDVEIEKSKAEKEFKKKKEGVKGGESIDPIEGFDSKIAKTKDLLTKAQQNKNKNEYDIKELEKQLKGHESDLKNAEEEFKRECNNQDERLKDEEIIHEKNLNTIKSKTLKAQQKLQEIFAKVFEPTGFSGGMKSLWKLVKLDFTNRENYSEFNDLNLMLEQNPEALTKAQYLMYEMLKSDIMSKQEMIAKQTGELETIKPEEHKVALDILLSYLGISKETRKEYEQMKLSVLAITISDEQSQQQSMPISSPSLQEKEIVEVVPIVNAQVISKETPVVVEEIDLQEKEPTSGEQVSVPIISASLIPVVVDKKGPTTPPVITVNNGSKKK